MALHHINQERIIQIQNIHLSDLRSEQLDSVVAKAKTAISDSEKIRKTFIHKKGTDPLYKSRSGKIAFKFLTKKQLNPVQSIPTDTFITYINTRI